jgi:hypothetical protein
MPSSTLTPPTPCGADIVLDRTESLLKLLTFQGYFSEAALLIHVRLRLREGGEKDGMFVIDVPQCCDEGFG